MPIAIVCMHVDVFPSTALLASKLLLVWDWDAILLWDISSIDEKYSKHTLEITQRDYSIYFLISVTKNIPYANAVSNPAT